MERRCDLTVGLGWADREGKEKGSGEKALPLPLSEGWWALEDNKETLERHKTSGRKKDPIPITESKK